MKRSTVLALGATAALAVAIIAAPVIADQSHGRHGGSAMMGGEDHMMDGGAMGHEMMEQMHGMMRGGMMWGGNRYALRNFDSDKDGTLTPEEFRAGLLGELTTYDADGDGTLSLAEFETLHAAHTRTMMVRGFQMLDEDGDGKVTEAEMTTVADMMQQHMARGPGAAAMPDADRPGNGMMDDN